jgi:hypothetical protein
MEHFGEWNTLENGPLWRMDHFGEWTTLENGTLWRMDHFGEWTTLENGPLWRMDHFGEWTTLENGPLGELLSSIADVVGDEACSKGNDSGLHTPDVAIYSLCWVLLA